MTTIVGTAAYRARTKYTDEAAMRYQRRSPRKHRAEMRLLARAFAPLMPGHVLDVPCGGGRMAAWLAGRGHRVTAADLSPAMRDIARDRLRGLDIAVDAEDAEALSYPDGEFDAVLCFRLFHHFPTPEIRARVVDELCRVSRRHVVLSYFSPWSGTALKRRLRHLLRGRPPAKFHTSLAEVQSYFERAGFVLMADHAQLRGIHSLHLAVFASAPSPRHLPLSLVHPTASA
ncbi:MAG: class I SAM-dependent methyltransferase [Candidatus Rokubacteria bacterium]|nr:class I SAM-dependent methyltransferase [Candidatus Rokubacteria bacterium]